MSIIVSIRLVATRAIRGRRGRVCPTWAKRVPGLVVQVVAGGGRSGTLTRHALAGGAVAGALAIAQAFAGPGLSELLAVLGALSVGAIAVSAAVFVARRHTARGRPIHARALIVATTVQVAPAHHQLLSVRALGILCNPRPALATAAGLLRHPRSLLTLGAGSVLAKAVFVKAARVVVKRLVVRPALTLVPGLGPTCELVGVYQTCIASARFLRHFESSAEELCALSFGHRSRPGPIERSSYLAQ